MNLQTGLSYVFNIIVFLKVTNLLFKLRIYYAEIIFHENKYVTCYQVITGIGFHRIKYY